METKEAPPKRPLRVKEAADVLGFNLHQTYRLIKQGAIPSIRIGGTILVPRAALDRMLGEAANA